MFKKKKKDKGKEKQNQQEEVGQGLTYSQKQLFELCSSREADVSRLESLLREDSLDPNFCFGPAATTPLWAASYWGHATIVQMLLPRMAAGACDLPNQSGVTPLMVACNRGHKDVVMCLFEGGANLDTVTGAGNSALHVGCSGGNPDVISALLHAGAKPFRNNFGQTPVDVASVCGHGRTFRHTFEKSPELKEESGSLSYHQRELIKECGANTPYLSRVYKLLRKASPNVRASWGATPLSIAVRKGSLPVVKALLQSHADVFAMDADGKTALVQAIDYHHTDIALLLLEHGSDVKAPYYKESPLIRATYNGCFELLNPLLERGADPNGYNAHGWTPLAFAMNRGFVDSFKTLLAGGADPLFKYKSDYKSAWETAHSNPPKYQPFIALMEPYCSKRE